MAKKGSTFTRRMILANVGLVLAVSSLFGVGFSAWATIEEESINLSDINVNVSGTGIKYTNFTFTPFYIYPTGISQNDIEEDRVYTYSPYLTFYIDFLIDDSFINHYFFINVVSLDCSNSCFSLTTTTINSDEVNCCIYSASQNDSEFKRDGFSGSTNPSNSFNTVITKKYFTIKILVYVTIALGEDVWSESNPDYNSFYSNVFNQQNNFTLIFNAGVDNA